MPKPEIKAVIAKPEIKTVIAEPEITLYRLNLEQ
jgi:hypothetical protein